MSEQDVDGSSAVTEPEDDSAEGEPNPDETPADAETETEAMETESDSESTEEESEANEKPRASSENESNDSEEVTPETEEDETGEQKTTVETDLESETEPAQQAEQTEGDTEKAQSDDTESLEEIAEEPAPEDDSIEELLSEDETLTENIPIEQASLTDEPDEQLVETIEDAPAETLAQIVDTLRAQQTQIAEQLADAHEQIDDLESRLARKQADFQNYKQRQKREQKRIKEQATEDFVTRILDVRDNLARALDQDEDVDIRGGVESTLKQFDQQLDRENVTRIEPQAGEDVDPKRHEVLATIASAEPEDTIAAVHRPGYEMGEKVLRPAQVAVSDGSQHDPESDEQADQE